MSGANKTCLRCVLRLERRCQDNECEGREGVRVEARGRSVEKSERGSRNSGSGGRPASSSDGRMRCCNESVPGRSVAGQRKCGVGRCCGVLPMPAHGGMRDSKGKAS